MKRCNYFTALLRVGFVLLSLSLSTLAQSVGDKDLFFRSVTDGTVEVVREGLNSHPDWANAELFSGIRPLYRAAVLGREEIAALLLSAGADVNATTDRGTSALHAAATNGNEAIFDHLVAAGAQVDLANDNGHTPLHLAVRFHHPALVHKLIACNADVNAQDASGRTPLHYAAGLGLTESVVLLLAAKAHLDPVDKFGFTPLGRCRTFRRNDFETVAQILLGEGATDLRPEAAWAKPESPAAPGAGETPVP